MKNYKAHICGPLTGVGQTNREMVWQRVLGTVAASSRGNVKKEIKALFLVHLSAKAALEERREFTCVILAVKPRRFLLEESHFDHHNRESRWVHRGKFPLDILNKNNNGWQHQLVSHLHRLQEAGYNNQKYIGLWMYMWHFRQWLPPCSSPKYPLQPHWLECIHESSCEYGKVPVVCELT